MPINNFKYKKIIFFEIIKKGIYNYSQIFIYIFEGNPNLSKGKKEMESQSFNFDYYILIDGIINHDN